ncbi:MAG: GNAT family N-acetyltransferase [Pseudomonadota bacterium]
MSFDAATLQAPLVTDRLTLRAPRLSDKGLLEQYCADKRVAEMTTSIPHPLPPGATEAFIARANDEARSEDIWILDGSENGMPEVIGAIGLQRLDSNQSEIGYWVAPGFWGQGYAREALSQLVEKNPQGVRTYFGSVFQDNPASARVLTHCGFDYIGDAESHSVARGAQVGTWTYLRKLD